MCLQSQRDRFITPRRKKKRRPRERGKGKGGYRRLHRIPDYRLLHDHIVKDFGIGP